MNTLYLDLFSGASGDMFLGLLIDLGASLADVEGELARLGLTGYHLHARRVEKCGLSGTKLDVHLDAAPGQAAAHPHPHPHDLAPHELRPASPVHGSEGEDLAVRHPSWKASVPPAADSPLEAATPSHGERDFGAIRQLLEASPLSPWVLEKAVAVFARVAEAEGRIHNRPPETVHFHEVGALDSLVDIVGSCIALDLLGRPQVFASAVVEGTGWIDCAHGRFPVPAPATLEILARRGVSLRQCDEPHELVTPTGAALLAEFALRFGPMPPLRIERVGYGLGTRNLETRPNALRGVLGTADPSPTPASHDWEADTVTVLETNLDDVTAEVMGHYAELARARGALDVVFTPAFMKKGRPGTVVTVLCRPEDADRMTADLLRETGTFGVRLRQAERRILSRKLTAVSTPFGQVTVKLGFLDGALLHSVPEYESCRSLAERAGVPVQRVFDAARRAMDAGA